MERAVITGMGVVSPIGNSLSEFETNLFAGHHGIVPIDHFDASDMGVKVYAPVRDLGASRTIPENELRRLDPYCVFGLLAARQAVGQAGLRGHVDPYRLGVFMSSGLGGTETLLGEVETMRQRGPRRVSPLLLPKWIPNMIAGIVSIDMGAHGASISHNAACASSAVSIGEGLRLIRHGYADAVICGGAEAIAQKVVMAGFQNMRALSTAGDPDRASIPFDRERKGFVLGEGGAAIVLESASHAGARGARSFGEITGYGVTSDASHITAPAADGEAIVRSIEFALREANALRPESGDEPIYVNAHGTGTVLNDRTEATAISRTLGDRALVSSTKSMTGHLLGGAGAVEVIASVMAIRKGLVPPTVGTAQIDDDIDIDIVTGAARRAPFSRTLSLSLGFGGHNVGLVIDAPED
ncbi:beta-ketoacyl-ACP synthase II [Propionimicrobium sp. PCR01-08-3]|uniref:beta-ketoacyl-[acyl-carrier-protein] synthase family protein n=1 Tax=Propionimicrobium sp. PCR01-08-3 TaxID=3052086 RepID=UPI00255C6924|nr:beta-ketoacyl-ACP synthase II [Propionimicrobium sp. PCR01-08-3]WIY83742.1 beta-ketoacyl-ACP synthase II [Propionimicrobium sp. PCR01-08-3]